MTLIPRASPEMYPAPGLAMSRTHLPLDGAASSSVAGVHDVGSGMPPPALAVLPVGRCEVMPGSAMGLSMVVVVIWVAAGRE